MLVRVCVHLVERQRASAGAQAYVDHRAGESVGAVMLTRCAPVKPFSTALCDHQACVWSHARYNTSRCGVEAPPLLRIFTYWNGHEPPAGMPPRQLDLTLANASDCRNRCAAHAECEYWSYEEAYEYTPWP